jgi:hypothetical protein
MQFFIDEKVGSNLANHCSFGEPQIITTKQKENAEEALKKEKKD